MKKNRLIGILCALALVIPILIVSGVKDKDRRIPDDPLRRSTERVELAEAPPVQRG